MTVPIQTLITWAIGLHDLEAKLDRWEIEVKQASAVIPTANPSRIERICRDVSILRIQTDAGFAMHCESNEAVRNQMLEGADDERNAILLLQKRHSMDCGTRLLELRGRLRRLDDEIGTAVSLMEKRSLTDILLLLLPTDGTFLVREAIEALVKAWHEAVAQAKATWRTMHQPHPILMIVGSSTRAEIQAALHEMHADGRVVRHRVPLTTWSLAPAFARAA